MSFLLPRDPPPSSFFTNPFKSRDILKELAYAVILYSGAESESKPEKGITPHIFAIYGGRDLKKPSCLSITSASLSIAFTPFLAQVTSLGNDRYRIDRVSEFPNGKTVAEFNVADYFSS